MYNITQFSPWEAYSDEDDNRQNRTQSQILFNKMPGSNSLHIPFKRHFRKIQRKKTSTMYCTQVLNFTKSIREPSQQTIGTTKKRPNISICPINLDWHRNQSTNNYQKEKSTIRYQTKTQHHQLSNIQKSLISFGIAKQNTNIDLIQKSISKRRSKSLITMNIPFYKSCAFENKQSFLGGQKKGKQQIEPMRKLKSKFFHKNSPSRNSQILRVDKHQLPTHCKASKKLRIQVYMQKLMQKMKQ